MIETRIVTSNELLKRIASIYQTIEQDQQNASKLMGLMRKLTEQEYTIAFCGHFSAGKSSMINELLTEDLLPSSPIPTSANVVKVKAGREYVRVFYRDGEIIEYPEVDNFESIKQYCKNGEDIVSIEISKAIDHFPKGIVIMDTPGIDSTDDAHRVATESALHLADVIFYVMDYNHVQSEQNFQFTKEMIDQHKSLYLIINQIDKHKEAELSFEDFKQGVIHAFEDWQVIPKGIYYTSLRQKQHQHNQLCEVKQLLSALVEERDRLLVESTLRSTQQIILDHMAYLDEIQTIEKEPYQKVIEQFTTDELVSVPNNIKELKSDLTSIKEQTKKVQIQFIEELTKLLNNAYLMPFSVRELAEQYIAACQPEFKVGLFFSKQKTEKEREVRLQSFFEKLKEQAESQLEWHIKQLVSNYTKQYDVKSVQPYIADYRIQFTKELLHSLIKQGAGHTGEYVLTYTEDVANELKKRYKHETLKLLDIIIGELEEKTKKDILFLEHEITKFEKIHHANQKIIEYKTSRAKMLEKLQDYLTQNTKSLEDVDVEDLLKKEELNKHIKIGQKELQESVSVINKQELYYEQHTNLNKDSKKITKDRVEYTISNLEKAKRLIEPVTGLSSIAKEMDEKANRLKNSQFTVALFGAFSAGKSSFANALLSEHVLPVSPNPTTATINKIKPPTIRYGHGTVLVKVKSYEQLLQDVNHSLNMFNISSNSLEEALIKINRDILQKSQHIEAKEKTHFSFLKAILDGYQSISSSLGELLTIDINGFQEFVANEKKACFVEWIELYYDCPLTRQGITLVDTPGADSINARHTGVAFDYIKNADAILFVTYYNHAFSKADREFLIQLGRVKDSFSMDKMFFILNASDLAHSSEELHSVKEYVKEQLIGYGIKFPRLYSVSSYLALQEKTNQDINQHEVLSTSGIEIFETDFRRFVLDELTDMAISAAYVDIDRARKVISSYLANAKENQEVKKERLRDALVQEQSISSLIKNVSIDREHKAIEQEITELIFYIKQRVFLRYPELFKEAFNPATIKEDGRDLKKTLWKCLKELLDAVGFDLSQEMRATSLRIETYIYSVLEEVLNTIINQIQDVSHDIQPAKLQKQNFSPIEFESGLQNLEVTQFKKVLSTFKNPRIFFEKNQKREISDGIQSILQEPVSEYLDEHKGILLSFYSEEFRSSVETVKEKLITEVAEYYQGIKQALSEEVNIEEMEDLYSQLLAMGRRNNE